RCASRRPHLRDKRRYDNAITGCAFPQPVRIKRHLRDGVCSRLDSFEIDNACHPKRFTPGLLESPHALELHDGRPELVHLVVAKESAEPGMIKDSNQIAAFLLIFRCREKRSPSLP